MRTGQNRHQQSAEREDGDSGSSSERGEERANEHCHDGWPAADLSKQSVENAHEPLWCVSLRQEISGEGKQRKCWEGGIDDQRIVCNRDGGNWLGCATEQKERRTSKRHKCRHSQKRSDQEHAH